MGINLEEPSTGQRPIDYKDRIRLRKYLLRLTEGGQGSGNYGHSGRPGEVGGSAPDDEGGPAYGLLKSDMSTRLYSPQSPIPHLASVTGKASEAGAVKKIMDNAHALLSVHESYFTSGTFQRAQGYLRQVEEVISAVATESKDTDAKTLDAFVQDSIQKLVYQEMESNSTQFTDHGVRHIVGNMERVEQIMASLGEKPMSAMEKLMAMTIMANHDIGYTVAAVRAGGMAGIEASAKHKEFSADIFGDQKALWNENKLFSSEQFERMKEIIRTHDDVDTSTDDLLKFSSRLADNLALFSGDKLPGMFAYVEGSDKELFSMGKAAREKNVKEFEASRTALWSRIDSVNLDPQLKRDLKAATKTLSNMSPKFTMGVLAGKISSISGKGHVTVTIEHNPFDKFLQKYFEMGQRQTKKLLEAYGIADYSKTEYHLGKYITIKVLGATRESWHDRLRARLQG